MRILFVTNELPQPTGGGMLIRDYNLLMHLCKNHSITLLCFRESDDENFEEKSIKLITFCEKIATVCRPRFRSSKIINKLNTLIKIIDPVPWSVRALTPNKFSAKYKELIGENQFDLIHINHIEMGKLFEINNNSKQAIGIEVVSQKVKQLIKFQKKRTTHLILKLEEKKLARYERNLFTSADLCTMASEVERNHVLRLSPNSKVVIIPNGVDTAYFKDVTENTLEKIEQKILFIGSMSYFPNQDAALYFYEEIWPDLKKRYPKLIWQIIGRDITTDIKNLELEESNIQVIGCVDDIRPYMKLSSVMIVPLRSGGGTRLKILEAMAAGLPVVSTTIGAEGIQVTHKKNIFITDDPTNFVNAIAELLTDQSTRHSISKEGMRLIEEKYGWQKIAKDLDTAYQSLF